LSAVRTISSGGGGGRKLNVYFYFFDVGNQSTTPAASSGGASSLGSAEDADAVVEPAEATSRRLNEVSGGFGYRRFNSEIMVARQNTPPSSPSPTQAWTPPPVAPRAGRAFLRAATGGSAASGGPEPDASTTTAASGPEVGGDSNPAAPSTEKKPASSLVGSLKFDRPGRRSLEVMSEEVTGGTAASHLHKRGMCAQLLMAIPL
jgi:hypothetical protein